MKKSIPQKIYKVIMLVLITAFITFLLTTAFIYKRVTGTYLASSGEKTTIISTSKDTNLTKIIKEFKTILENKYIGELDEEKMVEGAIKGYIEGVGDQYTTYLTKEEMQELKEETDSKYVGIGVYVANYVESNSILVMGVMNGSPALEAGIQAGDIIKKVNGVEYAGEELSKAVSVLKGEEGTEVTVTILRDEEEQDIKVVRKTIVVEHVASNMLEENIGYIQIDSFDDGVAKSFEEKFNSLKDEGMKALIIDLRNNGGGVVKEATDLASMFSKKGETVLITKDKEEKERKTLSNREPITNNMPVVVLVNGLTASASEILAGALRDNYGVKIVGNKTYGKGVIQTVYALSDGSGLKITTEEYFTPNHITINNVGIEPDVEIGLTKDENDKDSQLSKAEELLKEQIK